MLKYCFSISLDWFGSITEADQDLHDCWNMDSCKVHRGPTVPVKVLHYNQVKQNPACKKYSTHHWMFLTAEPEGTSCKMVLFKAPPGGQNQCQKIMKLSSAPDLEDLLVCKNCSRETDRPQSCKLHPHSSTRSEPTSKHVSVNMWSCDISWSNHPMC